MQLTVTGEMYLDPAALAWLPGYVRWEFDEAVAICRDANTSPYFSHRPNALTDDPWGRLHVKLHVHLRSAAFFVPVLNKLVGGLYDFNSDLATHGDTYNEPIGFDRPDMAAHTDKIDFVWTPDEWTRGMILRHEFCHMLWRHALMPNWTAFGHGGYDGEMDPYLVWIHQKIDRLYRSNIIQYPVDFRYPMGG